MNKVEVRIAHRGLVRDGTPTRDEAQVATCDLCHQDADAVASVSAEAGPPFVCKACLRSRLEAMTVGSWLLREAGDAGLPWGKVSG